MAEEFDGDAAAKELGEVVRSTGNQVRASLPPLARLPLFREDHGGNLVTRDGTLIRKKLEPLKLGGK
jgi:hypothetical protein